MQSSSISHGSPYLDYYVPQNINPQKAQAPIPAEPDVKKEVDDLHTAVAAERDEQQRANLHEKVAKMNERLRQQEFIEKASNPAPERQDRNAEPDLNEIAALHRRVQAESKELRQRAASQFAPAQTLQVFGLPKQSHNAPPAQTSTQQTYPHTPIGYIVIPSTPDSDAGFP
jgi:hypothetical protein